MDQGSQVVGLDRPHPEEPRSGVSKDRRKYRFMAILRDAMCKPMAPQDEGGVHDFRALLCSAGMAVLIGSSRSCERSNPVVMRAP
jgi:hypothetical protein